jgi:hypothetical protein
MKIQNFPKLSRWTTWAAIYAVLFAFRIGYIWYDRSRPFHIPVTQKSTNLKIDPDNLVAIPKFKIFDLAEARSLEGRTLWVKAGYRSEFVPLMTLQRSAPKGGPLRLLPGTPVQVKNVFENRRKEIELSIQHNGTEYATRIAAYDTKSQFFLFQLDDLFFPDNPSKYYPHWDAKTREQIASHQVSRQMTYAQVSLSLGSGQCAQIVDNRTQVYQFPSRPGGQLGETKVIFTAGKAVEIQ